MAFLATPMAGVGDGFVQLVARTRNHGGIRPKSLLAADFGTDWVATEPTFEGPAAKKFRGALDTYFQKLCDESKAACPPAPDSADDDKKDDPLTASLARHLKALDQDDKASDKNAHLALNAE